MLLTYVERPSLLLFLNDALDIEGAYRIRSERAKRPRPHITRVTHLASKPWGRPMLSDDAFETDGLGCIRLFMWIITEYPTMSVQARMNRFNALFSDNPTDALKAVVRISAGTDHLAPGEDGAYCADQWHRHPREMAAIRALGTLR